MVQVAKRLFILGFVMMFLLSFNVLADSELVDDLDYGTTLWHYSGEISSSRMTGISQRYIPSETFSLDKVEIYVTELQGSGVRNHNVRICSNYDCSGTVYGTSDNTVVDATGYFPFEFSTPVSLTESETYYVVILATSNSAIGTVDYFGMAAGDTTGSSIYSYVNGWSSEVTNKHLTFKTYAFRKPAFKITAKDIYTDTSILEFNATITNSTDTTTFTTTNGTIIWEYGDEELLDITIESNNFFNRIFTNFNTTNNLEAELHNIVVTAKNLVTDTTINSFTLTYNETSFSTNNGTLRTNLNLPETEGGTFNFTISATSYVSKNFTQLSTIPLEALLFPANSFTLNIFNAETLDPITEDFPYILEGTEDFYQTGNITNGTLVIEELTPDDYEINFVSDFYFPQIFYARLAEGEAIQIDAYLYDANTTLFTSVVTIENPSALPIEGALVSIQQRLQGNYRTVSQKYTDSTGKAAFFLFPNSDHRAIIEKTGFNTRVAEIRPISDPFAVTLRISPVSTFVYETAYDNVFFNYMPKIKQLNASVHTFNLSLSSPIGELQYFGVETIYGVTNVTGSPSGGTAVHTADLTNHTSSTLVVRYFFKSIGRQEYSFTVIYPFTDIKPSPVSLISIRDDPILQGMSPLLKFLFIIGLVILLLFVSLEIGVSPQFSAPFVLTGVLILAWVIGWIPIILPIIVGVLGIGTFFMGGRHG